MQTGLDGYRAWLGGQREALESTVVAYNKKLIYYIGSVLHDYGGAEDLASETFLRLLIKKPKFGEEGQLASWLYKTARNLAFDKHRRGRYEDPDAEIPVEQKTALERRIVELLARLAEKADREFEPL